MMIAVACPSGCGRGYCSGPNICTCDPNYARSSSSPSSPCTVPACDPPCQNGGVCQAYGTQVACKCPDEWTGTACSIRTCSANCEQHGTCSGSRFCVISCWSSVCIDIDFSCVCDFGWSGTNCDFRTTLYSPRLFSLFKQSALEAVPLVFVQLLGNAVASTDIQELAARVCCSPDSFKSHDLDYVALGDSSVCPQTFASRCLSLSANFADACAQARYLAIDSFCGLSQVRALCQTTPTFHGGCCPGFTGFGCVIRE